MVRNRKAPYRSQVVFLCLLCIRTDAFHKNISAEYWLLDFLASWLSAIWALEFRVCSVNVRPGLTWTASAPPTATTTTTTPTLCTAPPSGTAACATPIATTTTNTATSRTGFVSLRGVQRCLQMAPKSLKVNETPTALTTSSVYVSSHALHMVFSCGQSQSVHTGSK